jgi:hypothetical protein
MSNEKICKKVSKISPLLRVHTVPLTVQELNVDQNLRLWPNFLKRLSQQPDVHPQC